MMTVNTGTVICANAIIHVPPRRIVPAISCSSPTAKPGLSTRLRTGMWNRSQRSRWRVSLSQPSAVSAPPLTCRLSDAITPTGCPSKRAKPTTWSVPHSDPISKNESRSAIRAIARRTSNVVVRLRGTIVEQLLVATIRRVVRIRRRGRAEPRTRSTAGRRGSASSSRPPRPRSPRGCRPSRCDSAPASRRGPPS